MTSILVPAYAVAIRPAFLQQPIVTKLLGVKAIGLEATVVRRCLWEWFHRPTQENSLDPLSADVRGMAVVHDFPYMVINKFFAFVDVQKHESRLPIC